MRICILSNDYPPILGGIPNYVKGLHQGFRSLGHPSTLLFFPVNKSFGITENDVFEFPVKGRRHFQRVQSSMKLIKKNIDTIENSELIILPTWSPTGIAFSKSKVNGKSKSVLLAHGNDILEPSNSFRYRRIMKKVFHHFDFVLTNSQFTADLCYELTGRKSFPIGAGLDERYLNSDRNKNIQKINSGSFTILSVGRLVERKGFDIVIKSLGKIKDKMEDWHYVIIGSGPFKKHLEKLIYDHHMQEQITLLENQTFEDLFSWYEKCDVFIMVSRMIPEDGEVEGLGLVYMEAGASQVPVIAGNSGGVSDVVKNGINGLLVDPYSEKEISDAIYRLYRDENLMIEMGRNGRVMAETEWRWAKVAQKIIDQVKGRIEN